MTWEITIGLETHVQLNTVSKIFSGASTQFGAKPNLNASAVDMALPGVLPVMNKEAVEKAIIFGLAVGSHIAPVSQFERKNYFYPDLPKAYQITQLAVPIASGGSLTIKTQHGEKTIALTRAHLEEDAGKSIHDQFSGFTGIDLNRAGTPLIEIVTEPVMHSSEEAVAYAKALHSLVTWLGICDGNMQEGSFRCDANVSVRRVGDPVLGTRREIKNLNSFKFLQSAIEYEARWQIEQLSEGRSIQQATVLFNTETGETKSMRTKEDAHDYRYFPDPDLPPLVVSKEWLSTIQSNMPVLQTLLKQTFIEQGVSVIDTDILIHNKPLCDYYQAVVRACSEPKLAVNWVLGEVNAALNRADSKNNNNNNINININDKDDDNDVNDEAPKNSIPISLDNPPVSAEQLGLLISRVSDNTISNTVAKKLFIDLWVHNSDGLNSLKHSNSTIIDEWIEIKGLKQITDTGALEGLIDSVIANNAQAVAEFKSGKVAAFNALVGQCMKAAKGKASPTIIHDLLRKKLA